MENVLHNREEILTKEFKKTRIGTGYDMTDVDAFWTKLCRIIKRSKVILMNWRHKTRSWRRKLLNWRSKYQLRQRRLRLSQRQANTNMDILKRLSNLERRVFGTAWKRQHQLLKKRLHKRLNKCIISKCDVLVGNCVWLMSHEESPCSHWLWCQ